VNNLNPEMEDEELRSLSSQFGQVSSASINVNRDGSSKGSGVVKFVRLDSAMEAIQQLDSKEYKGNRLQVSTSHRETKEQIGRKNNPQKTDLISPSNDDKRELYVRNIDDSLDENSIKLAFEKVVTIEQVRIVKQRKVCKLYVIANMLVFLISGPYFLQFAVRIIKEIWFCHRRVSQ